MGALSGLANVLLIASAIANIVVGFLVFSRNKQILINRYFVGLTISLAGWSVTNILFQIIPADSQYLVALLSYGFAGSLATCFFLFSQELDGKLRLKHIRLLVGAGIVVSVVGVIPGVLATGVTPAGAIEARIPALAVYGVVLVTLMGNGLRLLFHKLRTAKGVERARVQLILIGLSIGAGIGLTCNLLLPLNGIYSWVAFGPSGGLVFVSMAAYAIVKHRLFDIRSFVVRSIAYVITLLVLAAAYGVIVFGTATFLLHLHFSILTQASISLATAVAGLAFSSVKRFFDKVSNRLFYRDAYDPQELLDHLNRLFVHNTNLEQLLHQSASVIQESLKAEYCIFGIKEMGDMPQRTIGSGGGSKKFSHADIEAVRQATPSIHRKIIIADELNGTHEELREVLESNNIAVLGRLIPTATSTEEGLGYLVLGYRRNGSPYAAEDIRTLEIIVNELVIAIQNSLRLEEIQHFNATLQQNVNDATRKLRRTNDKLKALDETKDEFITMASHQLRTPLTSVKGYLSMVLEGDAGKLNPNQRKLLDQSFMSSQRMVYLISDLLNLSRLNTGKFVIEPSMVDLSEIVQAEFEQLAETAKAREVELIYKKPATFPQLMLDETKTHQVVMNLMDNAIYYTRAGGTVTVELKETPTAVEYLVHDTGIGVPKAVQHKLFTKFYRAANAQQARPDGTGLGLFMVRKVIAAQGGAIIFDSVEGKGSTFGFRFNKAKLAPPKAGAPVTSPVVAKA